MKKLACIISVVTGVLMISAFALAAGNSLLLDSWEGQIIGAGITSGSMAGNVDYGAGGGSSLEIYADKTTKVDGEQSIKLVFFAMPGGWMWCARGYNIDVKGAAAWLVKPDNIKWNDYDTISFWWKGTGSGKILAFDIIDAKKEYFRFTVKDESTEWKQIIAPFKDFAVRTDWQPATAVKNGVLDFPIMTYQFEPRPRNEAEWNFDKVELINTGAK